MFSKPYIIVFVLSLVLLSGCTSLSGITISGGRPSSDCNYELYTEGQQAGTDLLKCQDATQMLRCEHICPLGGCDAQNPGIYDWATYVNCGDYGVVCIDGGCYYGCVYEEKAYVNGEKGCLDETNRAECVEPNVVFEDCSATANPYCYEGTCIPIQPATCYQIMNEGSIWKVNEPYVLNPANMDGMPEGYVEWAVRNALQAWEDEAGYDIFGEGSLTTDTLVIGTPAPDGINGVSFGSSPGAVATTIVWGIWDGPIENRELVEWDIIFNEAEYYFGDSDIMPWPYHDLLSVAIHEAGHAAGLIHPNGVCTEETMYYAAYPEETKKRTLNVGDIAGIQELYGVSP